MTVGAIISYIIPGNPVISERAMASRIWAVYYREEGEIADEVTNYFVASRNPFYLGLIIKPSLSVWEILKESSEVNLRLEDGRMIEFEIPYKIEVGESTIFFVKPTESYRYEVLKIFLSQHEKEAIDQVHHKRYQGNHHVDSSVP